MKKGFVLGEAVKDRTTGRKMYVEVVWNQRYRAFTLIQSVKH
ncbi:Uncharacterized protein NV38_0001529 [Leptospira kirschneri serovar Mozdok]|nr:Uncharacterized protein NV38_0001529 [Leptospira kirschneri serovar Mozdok]